jgi:hypothetical protein
MSSDKVELFPDLVPELYKNGQYNLDFDDIIDYYDVLHQYAYEELKSGDKDTVFIKDLVRMNLDKNTMIYIPRLKKKVKLTFEYPSNNEFNYQDIKFHESKFKYLRSITPICKVKIFMILHMFYTRRIIRPILYIDNNNELLFQIIELLYLNDKTLYQQCLDIIQKPEFLKLMMYYLPRMHLITMLFHQTTQAEVMTKLLPLYSKILNVSQNSFMDLFNVKATSEQKECKMDIILTSSNTGGEKTKGDKKKEDTVKLEITQINYYFLAIKPEYEGKHYRGIHINDIDPYFEIHDFFRELGHSIVQYQVIETIKVVIGEDSCPMSVDVKMISYNTNYRCQSTVFKLPDIITLGKKRTNKRSVNHRIKNPNKNRNKTRKKKNLSRYTQKKSRYIQKK